MAQGYKTGGRKKGSTNRLSGTVKEMLHLAVKNEIEMLPSLISQLEPKEKIDIILKILPFILPKADVTPQKQQTIMEKHAFITSLLNGMQRNE
jgi:hypothetical protein